MVTQSKLGVESPHFYKNLKFRSAQCVKKRVIQTMQCGKIEYHEEINVAKTLKISS